MLKIVKNFAFALTMGMVMAACGGAEKTEEKTDSAATEKTETPAEEKVEAPADTTAAKTDSTAAKTDSTKKEEKK